jgi:peptide deformylase
MTLRIVHFDEPVLRTKGEKVTRFDADLRRLVQEMFATMHAAPGIGLAAQQIDRALQLCVVDVREEHDDFNWTLDGVRIPLSLVMPLALANPVVTVAPGTRDATADEGCLSFPELRGDVIRPEAIRVTFQDVHGIGHELACDGLLARCIQHEVDHLQGVLFIDRMKRRSRAALEPDLVALAKATRAAARTSPSL